MPEIRGEEIAIHLGEDAFEDVNTEINFTYCAECAVKVLIPRGHNVPPKSNIRGLAEGQQIKTMCIVCKQMKCINWLGETISDPIPKLDEYGNIEINPDTGDVVLHRHGDCETCTRVILNPPEFPDLPDVCGYWYEQNKDKIASEIQKRVKKLVEDKQVSPEELEWQRMVQEQKEKEAEQELQRINPDDFFKEDFLPELPELSNKPE